MLLFLVLIKFFCVFIWGGDFVYWIVLCDLGRLVIFFNILFGVGKKFINGVLCCWFSVWILWNCISDYVVF